MKLIQVISILLLSVVLSFNLALSQAAITVQLKIVYANTDSTTLKFGNDKTATYCLDSLLGESGLPPTPLAGNFDARFTDPRGYNADCTDQGTASDFRHWETTTVTDTFEITFQKGSAVGNYVFSWPAGLSTHFQSCTLMDQFGGFLVNVDMLTSTSVNVNSSLTKLNIFATPIVNDVRLVDDIIPRQFALNQNYPNPFNPSTTISFAIQKAVVAEIAIYDVLGRKVRTLASEHLMPGVYNTQWSGTDDHGNTVGSGVYYVRMSASDASSGQAVFSAVRKLMLTK